MKKKEKIVKKKLRMDWRIVVTAILALTVLEIYALSRGINGILLTVIVGAICAIAGVAIPTPKVLFRE